MQTFQMLGSAFLLGVFVKFVYTFIKNRNYILEADKYGRRHKRDVRNGYRDWETLNLIVIGKH